MDREQAKFLLSEYVLGQLDAAEAAAVSACLAEDPELRRAEEFLRWIQPRLVEMKGHLPGEHPTGAELVSAALGQGDVPDERGDWVRNHLADCDDCLQLVATISKANAELERGDPVRPLASSRLPRQWVRLAMAAVIAFVLFGTGIWIGQRDQNQGPASIHLAGIARGQEAAADVSPSADGQLPPLVLECDPWVGRASAADFLLEIRLQERETRQVVHTLEISAARSWSAEEGGIGVTFEAGALPAGDYDIEVRDDTGRVIFQTGFHLLPR
jgi:anti-sigma factor RsiW